MATRPATRICTAVCGLLVGLGMAAGAGPLRDRLRERLAARIEQKMGPAGPAIPLAAGATISGPGHYEIHLQHDGRERMALVHVPQSYAAAAAAPLVMALHGGGGGMTYQANDQNYGLITKSEQAGFIAVFPNGISSVRSGMLATWNAGNCCAKARDENVDDVGFLRKLVDDVSRRVSIDRRRVYAIGMSNGAMMAYRLACEAPDVFMGIMAVAGTDNTRHCEPGLRVPVLHVHARNDDRVLFAGGAGKAFRREAMVTDFVSVPASVAKWVKLNNANPVPRRVLTVAGADCDLYDAGVGGAPVQLCLTDTGKHSWPGSQKNRGTEPPSPALSANDLMWEFFSRH